MPQEDLTGGDTSPVNVEEEEEDGEDLFGNNLEADYRPLPNIDRYDDDQCDDEFYDAMTDADRMAAEIAMQKRDRAEGIYRRDDFGLIYDDEDDVQDPKRRYQDKAYDDVESFDMIESIENLEDTKGESLFVSGHEIVF